MFCRSQKKGKRKENSVIKDRIEPVMLVARFRQKQLVDSKEFFQILGYLE